MKKYTLSAILLLITLFNAYSVNPTLDNPKNHIYFGLRGSLDMCCPQIEDYEEYIDLVHPGMGFSIGGILNIPVIANLYLEPGLTLYYHTWSMSQDAVDEMIKDIPDEYKGMDIKNSFRNFGMRVPLMIGYHFDAAKDVKLSIFTGPELVLGFTNNLHLATNLNGEKNTYNKNMYGDNGFLNRVDCAWKVGGSISYSHYYLGVSGGFGLSNLAQKHQKDLNVKARNVYITIGYNF